MKRAAAAVLALCSLTRQAAACPCSDDPGSSLGLVRADELYAAALVATSRRALGRFDAFGHYAPLAAAEGEVSEELLLRVGVRAPRRLEWIAELGYSSYRFHAPRLVERQNGVGDALLRARYRVLDEGMPHEPFLPAVSLSGLVRAPLGAAGISRAGSFGSGGAQRGLGTWELGGGLELSRAILPKLELVLAGEAAYRFEDHVLGSPRRLGPRVEAVFGARALPNSWLSGSVALRLRVTSDVTLAGRRLDGTAERLWTVVAGAAAYDAARGFRSALTLSFDPPWAGFSSGATAAVAIGVSLGVGVR